MRGSGVAVGEGATTTAPASDPVHATDAIIEELKVLARSMLEATNAARRKMSAGERSHSYDTLLRAVRGDAAHARHDSDAGSGHALHKSTTTSAAGDDTSAHRRHVDPACDSGVAEARVDNDDDIAADEPVQQQTQRDDSRVSGHDDDEDDEEEAHVYDGVRTQVLFRTTDAAAYDALMTSMWKPEALWRYVDGTTTPYSGDDDDDDDDDDDGATEAKAHMTTRRQAQRVAVFRVPLFPYGGGVTEAQARELQAHFDVCVHKERKRDGSARTGNNNSNKNKPTTAAAATAALAPAPRRPCLVRTDAFAQRRYDEVPSAAALPPWRAPFCAASPYDFVVEVERGVVFDAVRAREQRRRAFEQLVREQRAPAMMGTFNLRIIMDPLKTGFEEEKDFPIVRGSVVADRYEIIQLLGKATFSRAVRCYDLHQPIYDDDDHDDDDDDGKDEDTTANAAAPRKPREPSGYAEVCLKIINNSKDFFDQSLDEIRLLTLINRYKDADEAHVVRLIDAFYYKEHTMLVTELLSDNLYEYSKYNRKYEDEPYFTLPRLRRIAWQVLEALAYVHSLNLIHTDLKPENILFVSHRRCIVKVIDFGSSCFLSDHLSSYIQSRSYRAPEVVLGCDYDGRIDVWSLGAILVELVTGEVLFTSETVPEMLARIVHVCGRPLPRHMLWEGRHTSSFVNKFGCIYEMGSSSSGNNAAAAAAGGGGNTHHAHAHHGGGGRDDARRGDDSEEPYYLYTPVHPQRTRSTAANGVDNDDNKDDHDDDDDYGVLRDKLARAGMLDSLFFSFVKSCLTLDHKLRPTSQELLQHPFFATVDDDAPPRQSPPPPSQAEEERQHDSVDDAAAAAADDDAAHA